MTEDLMSRVRRTRIVALVAAALAFAIAYPADGAKIELPADTVRLKPGDGADVATSQCAACHSFDYVATQPPGKPLAFWKAEVEKMRKVYGAQIPDDQVDPIARYLTRAYGDGK
jgi:mono/diheme cytochrome c family protein